MNKNEFLKTLRKALHRLPPEELERRINYYQELLEDMTDDGMTEEEAVQKLGDPGEIAESILREQPLGTLLRSAAKPKKGWNALSIVLAIVGSPVWLSLLVAILAVILGVSVALWAIVLAVVAAGIAGVVGGFLLLGSLFFAVIGAGNIVFFAGVGLAAIGLGIGLFLGGLWLAKELLRGTGKGIAALKNKIIRKDKNENEDLG